jgi:hypothetical protein
MNKIFKKPIYFFQNFAQIPSCLYTWSQLMRFRGNITKILLKYKLFLQTIFLLNIFPMFKFALVWSYVY